MQEEQKLIKIAKISKEEAKDILLEKTEKEKIEILEIEREEQTLDKPEIEQQEQPALANYIKIGYTIDKKSKIINKIKSYSGTLENIKEKLIKLIETNPDISDILDELFD